MVTCYFHNVCVGLLMVTKTFAVTTNISWLLQWPGIPLCIQVLQPATNNSTVFPDIYEQIIRNGRHTTIIRSPDNFLRTNVSAAYGIPAMLSPVASTQRACLHSIMFADSAVDLLGLFEPGDILHYMPQSIIFVMAAIGPPSGWSPQQLKFIDTKAILVFWVQLDNSTIWAICGNNFENIALHSVDVVHKFMDDHKRRVLLPSQSQEHREPLRISFIDCVPYVSIRRNGENITHIDGLEYRFISEITARANYPLAWVDHRGIRESFELPPNDLHAGHADLAMCSMWMSLKRTERFEMSDFVDFQCGTSLVPKPVAVSSSAYVYLAFSVSLWLSLWSAFGIVVIVRCAVDAWNATEMRAPRAHFAHGLHVLLEGVDVLTGHGIHRLPRDSAHRMVLISWTLLSLMLGCAYTTRYTALLTTPIYERRIDTLQELVDHNLRWGYPNTLNDHGELKVSSVNYQKLYHLGFHESTLVERLENLQRSDYAILVKVLQQNYVVGITKILHQAASYMHMMNTCFYNHYTVFLLRRQSPHVAYLNKWIHRYRESGILMHWSSQMVTTNERRHMRLFFMRTPPAREAHAWSVTSLSGAGVVLCFGYALSGVVFVLEWVAKRCGLNVM